MRKTLLNLYNNNININKSKQLGSKTLSEHGVLGRQVGVFNKSLILFSYSGYLFLLKSLLVCLYSSWRFLHCFWVLKYIGVEFLNRHSCDYWMFISYIWTYMSFYKDNILYLDLCCLSFCIKFDRGLFHHSFQETL